MIWFIEPEQAVEITRGIRIYIRYDSERARHSLKAWYSTNNTSITLTEGGKDHCVKHLGNIVLWLRKEFNCVS